MKTVGIITLVFNNYGTRLQSYALCQTLKKLGYDPHVINMESNWGGSTVISWKEKIKKVFRTYGIYGIPKLFSILKWKKQMKAVSEDKEIESLLAKRNESFNKINRLIPYTEKYYSFQDLRKGKYPQFDYYLVGSDQTFNGVKVGNQDIFMLDFLKERKGYTYAASFGMTTIPPSMYQEYMMYINNFRTLLMREEEGVKLCNQLGRMDAKLVLDPTLLLSEEDYNIVYEDEEIVDGDYVLVYSLNNSLKIYNQANNLSKKTGCKMVMLKRGACPPKPAKYKNSIEMYNVSPGGFLWLIKCKMCYNK